MFNTRIKNLESGFLKTEHGQVVPYVNEVKRPSNKINYITIIFIIAIGVYAFTQPSPKKEEIKSQKVLELQIEVNKKLIEKQTIEENLKTLEKNIACETNKSCEYIKK